MWVTSGSISSKGRLATKHYKPNKIKVYEQYV